jgi:hypothetical protein
VSPLSRRTWPLALVAFVAPLAAADRTGELLASKALEALRTPDRVESLPVESLIGSTDKTTTATKTSLPGRFRIVPEPKPVPADVARQLSRLLLSRRSYSDHYTLCGFDPGVAFRFWKGSDAVDVLVCFTCTDLGFQAVGAPEALGPKLAFDPIRGDLARLVRAARPDEPPFETLEGGGSLGPRAVTSSGRAPFSRSPRRAP